MPFPQKTLNKTDDDDSESYPEYGPISREQ